MASGCKGLCMRIASEKIQRPIYNNHRWCTECQEFMDYDMFVCVCCKKQTRGKPHNRINRQKYIIANTSNINEIIC